MADDSGGNLRESGTKTDPIHNDASLQQPVVEQCQAHGQGQSHSQLTPAMDGSDANVKATGDLVVPADELNGDPGNATSMNSINASGSKMDVNGHKLAVSPVSDIKEQKSEQRTSRELLDTEDTNSKGRHSSGASSDSKTAGKSLAATAADAAKQKEKEERLKQAKERAAHERSKKIVDLKEAQRKAQDFRKKQEDDRRRKLDEMKKKEDSHRQLVEERRKKLLEVDTTRKKEIMRRSEEREARIDGSRTSRRSAGGGLYAFGSRLSMSTCRVDAAVAIDESDGPKRAVSQGNLLRSSPRAANSMIVSPNRAVSACNLASPSGAGRHKHSSNLQHAKLSSEHKAQSALDLHSPRSSDKPPAGSSKPNTSKTTSKRLSLSTSHLGPRKNLAPGGTPKTSSASRDKVSAAESTGVLNVTADGSGSISPAPKMRSKSADFRRSRADMQRTIERLSTPRIKPKEGSEVPKIHTPPKPSPTPPRPMVPRTLPKEPSGAKPTGASNNRGVTPTKGPVKAVHIKLDNQSDQPRTPHVKDSSPLRERTGSRERSLPRDKPAEKQKPARVEAPKPAQAEKPKASQPKEKPAPKEKVPPKEKPAVKAVAQKAPAKAATTTPSKEKVQVATKSATPAKDKNTPAKDKTKDSTPKPSAKPKDATPAKDKTKEKATPSKPASKDAAPVKEKPTAKDKAPSKEDVSAHVSEKAESEIKSAPAEAAPTKKQSPPVEKPPAKETPKKASPTEPAKKSPTEPHAAVTLPKKEMTPEEQYKAKIAENRRVAREKAEREAEEQRLKDEEVRRQEEERQRREEEEERRQMEEAIRLAEEARKAEEERLQKAIEAEEARKREEQERLEAERIAKEEADQKAQEESERKEKERVERLKKDEEERLQRKKRLEMIMKRVKTDDGSPKVESPGSPSRSIVSTPPEELPAEAIIAESAAPVQAEPSISPSEVTPTATSPVEEQPAVAEIVPPVESTPNEETTPKAQSPIEEAAPKFKSPLLQQMLGKNKSKPSDVKQEKKEDTTSDAEMPAEKLVTEESELSEVPVTQEPTEEPVAEQSTETPISQEPSEEPVVEEPAKELFTEEPVTEQSAETVAQEPVEEEPGAEETDTVGDSGAEETTRSLVEEVITQAAETSHTEEEPQAASTDMLESESQDSISHELSEQIESQTETGELLDLSGQGAAAVAPPQPHTGILDSEAFTKETHVPHEDQDKDVDTAQKESNFDSTATDYSQSIGATTNGISNTDSIGLMNGYSAGDVEMTESQTGVLVNGTDAPVTSTSDDHFEELIDLSLDNKTVHTAPEGDTSQLIKFDADLINSNAPEMEPPLTPLIAFEDNATIKDSNIQEILS